MMRRIWGAAVVSLLVGCGGKSPCDAKKLQPGELKGTIDGELWTSTGAVWEGTPFGLRISADSGGGHAVTINLLEDIEGTPVVLAREDHAYPIEVDFASETTGSATFVHSTGNAMAAAPDGWVRVDRIAGGELQGCFATDVSDSFDTYSLEASWSAQMVGL